MKILLKIVGALVVHRQALWAYLQSRPPVSKTIQAK